MSQLSEKSPAATNGAVSSAPLSAKVEQEIRRALEGLAYGSVEIVIHDSKVVQIERKEKVRFN